MSKFNSIEKIVSKCGCVSTSKLDIIENEITENFIKICKKHFLPNINNKLQYTYYKSQNVYISNSEISNNILKNNIKKISSEVKIDFQEDKYHILQFGKYKYKSFNYVYNNDKIYCYNLSFWKHNKIKDVKNKAISEFVNYIREEINTY